MDIIPATLTVKDPGEFQFWCQLATNALHRVDAEAAIADADKVIRAARARIPIVVEASLRQQ